MKKHTRQLCLYCWWHYKNHSLKLAESFNMPVLMWATLLLVSDVRRCTLYEYSIFLVFIVFLSYITYCFIGVYILLSCLLYVLCYLCLMCVVVLSTSTHFSSFLVLLLGFGFVLYLSTRVSSLNLKFFSLQTRTNESIFDVNHYFLAQT